MVRRYSSYAELLEKAQSLTVIKERIVKDLHRTHLVSTDLEKQESLCKILLCVAYVFPEITYCQGMNCVAAVLLLALESEESCVFMFIAIIKDWSLAKIYEPGLPDLMLREFQFNCYAKKLMPDLYLHLKNEGITTGFFMSRWYLTMFSIYLPLETCLHIWDSVFHSKWKAIIKVSLALMVELKPKLVSMDKSTISGLLRDSARESVCNYDKVLKTAGTIKVKNSELRKFTEEFYIQLADFKLKNNESYFTEEENTALYETKLILAEHSEENLRLIQEIQKNIEVYGKKVEELWGEAREMEKQIHELENQIEAHCDRKAAYSRTLEELKKGYVEGKKVGILKEDLACIEGKILKTDEALRDLKREYIDKVLFI